MCEQYEHNYMNITILQFFTIIISYVITQKTSSVVFNLLNILVLTHHLRNDLIRVPVILCEFGAMNAKYQMHLRLRELANQSNPTLYPPMLINVDTLNKSVQRLSDYLKIEVIKSYVCIMDDCYVCDNSN